ncbi:MAG: DUF4136 domain-containing protein [Gemmatimonadales bacterium]
MTAIVFDTRFQRAGALLAVVLAAGCSSSVTSERNEAIAIPSGATVTLPVSGAQRTPELYPTVSNDSIHHMIQRAIKAQLAAKGYTVVDSGQPATFVARYFLGVQTSSRYAATAGGVSGPPIQGIGNGYGRTQDTPLSALPSPGQIHNVTFEAALVDEKAGRTAWRGVLDREPKSTAPDQARINQVVGEVMKSLPQVP